jgi:hypothetical protein
MEVQEISASFLSNGFPCELDEEMAQYLREILEDLTLTTQERFDIIFGILESSFGEGLQESLSKIVHDLLRKLNQKQNSRHSKKKGQRESAPVKSPPPSSPPPQLPPQAKPDPVRSKKVERLPAQPYVQSCTSTTESPQLRSLRKILHEHGVVSSELDETIAEYLNEICSDEMMSLEELQEIMLTYFPSLDGDTGKAKQIVFALLSQGQPTHVHEAPTPRALSPTEDTRSDCDSYGNEEDKSVNDSENENDDSELSAIDVSQLQEIFPLVPVLSLQYVFHVKCFDSFTDACQYLLDHQTGHRHLVVEFLTSLQMPISSSCRLCLDNIATSLSKGAFIFSQREMS